MIIKCCENVDHCREMVWQGELTAMATATTDNTLLQHIMTGKTRIAAEAVASYSGTGYFFQEVDDQ